MAFHGPTDAQERASTRAARAEGQVLPLGTVKTRTRLALMRLSAALREDSVSGAAPG